MGAGVIEQGEGDGSSMTDHIEERGRVHRVVENHRVRGIEDGVR